MKLRVAKKVLGFTARRSWSWEETRFVPRKRTFLAAGRRWSKWFNRRPSQRHWNKIIHQLEEAIATGKKALLPDELTL